MGKALKFDSISFLFFAAFVFVFYGCFADDAFIVARYAENLAHGVGLVFNQGDAVNALTSPLHAFFMAGLAWLTGGSVRAYVLLAAVAVFWVAGWAAHRMFAFSPEKARLYQFLLLTFPPVVFWTLGGLETPILLVLILLICACAAQDSSVRGDMGILVLCALAGFTRYDMVLLLGPLVCAVLWRRKGNIGVWGVTVFLAALFFLWFAWCYWHYGDLLPTSFYNKNISKSSAGVLGKGMFYELSLGALLLLPLALALLLGRRRLAENEKLKSSVTGFNALMAGSLFYGVYGLFAGTVHMMYLYRLFVPIIPVLLWAVLRRLPVTPKPLGYGLMGLVQLALVYGIDQHSLNFNLALLIPGGQDWYEFSRAGAGSSNKQANKVFAQQAQAIERHWQAQGRDTAVVPRMAVWTEGQPGYQLKNFYVYGPLVSYRHECRADYFKMAHYVQDIQYLPADAAPPQAKNAQGWELVTYDDMPIREWGGERKLIRVLWFFKQPELAHTLPARVHGACR
ncbi:hypothetical protein [Vandammella animalimorsus]|uniref:Glycosyltransferase RgtA/B/C/D-like domain-containing protein n=1 Tax=Vandammella animalimorsus TaxID=2029117 RepID=A0A2A2AC71_9BURK|nr:hypothetical protein [Vandammella animalimorsus]PAT35406.1 hypothetical protein CK620_05950 [Vandammella animalimorsus]